MFVASKESSSFTRDIQTVLRRLGKTLMVDGELGPITVGAINSLEDSQIIGDYLDYKNSPIKLSNKVPKWIRIAVLEIGVKEIKGPKHNLRIIEYMNATKWGKWVHDDETPWCAGFIGWCMVKAGYEDEIPDYSLGAKSWLNFGVSAGKPVFGAIAVKSRKGGGHVGFVVGENKARGTLYILGGNQSDAVCVKEYPKSVWIDFRIPEDYTPSIKLSVWKGPSSLPGSEA
jgi:uncharacterized protein (TIGR02594 family)